MRKHSKKYYKYVDYVLKMANGTGLSKEGYLGALDIRNVMLVGSVDTIINKLVYQFKTYKHNRHFFQIDLGGMPFSEVKRMVKIIGEEIIPQVRARLGEDS